MVTGASTADVAVILIDARKGVLTQTRRHSYIVSLLGIRHVVLAINKMDLVDYSQQTFDEIVADVPRVRAADRARPTSLPFRCRRCAATTCSSAASACRWYQGPTLMSYLESVEIEDDLQTKPFRLPVQWVNRPNQDFRGFAGTIASGTIRRGDNVRALPSGRQSRVTRIVTYDGDLESAVAGQSVTLTLADEIDVSRGDVLAAADAPPAVADQFQATIIWMHEEPMLPGRPYLIKLGTRTRHRQHHDAEVQGERQHAGAPRGEAAGAERDRRLQSQLRSRDRRSIRTPRIARPAASSSSTSCRTTPSARACCTSRCAAPRTFTGRRSTSTSGARSSLKGQRACVLWFTGLSGAGKSTIANLVEKRLHALGRHTYMLDGDNVRHGLNKDLGFTDADRVENIRRVAEVSRLMVDAGLIVLVSFISPFRSERRLARELMQPGEFFEVFVDTPLAEAEKRDLKGLYSKARRGELKNFTGIDSPYEAPEHPEIHLQTVLASPEDAAEQILRTLRDGGLLQAPDEGASFDY